MLPSPILVHRFETRTLLFLVLLQAGLLGLLVGGTEQDLPVPSELTIIAPPLERTFGELSPYGPGFERELVASFTQRTGVETRWIITADWHEAWELFTSGTGDLLIAPGFVPPEIPDSIVPGPVYAAEPPALLRSNWEPGLSSPLALCSTPVVTAGNPAMAEALSRKGQELECTPAPVSIPVPADKLLNELEHKRIRYLLMDGGRFELFEPFYSSIRRTLFTSPPVGHRWYWRTEPHKFSEALDSFWEGMLDHPALADLKEKYFGYLPPKTDYYQISHFLRTLTSKAPQYTATILSSAWENKIDPLLLLALIYQESRFDPAAKSKTGVRGLLQLTLPTAWEMNVKSRLDPHANIRGGAKYLRIQWERLGWLEELDPWDRWFFALSAYNQGMGHTRDAMRLAESMGKDRTSWRELKTIFPLLSYSKYYKRLQHGYARGYEAVDFVESIRYYYAILHGLVFLGRPEAQHLAPFFDAIPPTWP